MAQQLDNIGDLLLTKITTPYVNLESITGFTEDVTGVTADRSLLREFRYSFDSSTFSSWEEMTNTYLQGLTFPSENNTYVEIRYTRTGSDATGSIVINSIDLTVTLATTTETETNPTWFTQVECATCDDYITDVTQAFNPYDIKNAFCMYDKMSQVVTKIWGHCVKYYRVTPDQDSKDVIFKEFSLFDSTSGNAKNLNIMFPDNQFPSSETIQTLYGLDYDQFDIHITKSEFEEVFGSGTRPQRHDFMYIEILDKLYQIESAYLEQSFMNDGIYYIVNLSKYEEKDMVEMDSTVEQEVNDLTVTMEELYREEKEEQIEKVTKPLEYNVIGTGEDDYIRSQLNKMLTINDETILNNYTTISRNNYSFSLMKDNEVGVVYRTKIDTTNVTDKSYTVWFQSQFETSYSNLTITNITTDGVNVDITFDIDHNYTATDLIRIQGTGYHDGTYRVASVLTTSSIRISSVETATYTGSDPNVYAKRQIEGYLLYGDDSGNGFSVKAYSSGIIYQNNATEKIFDFGVLPEGEWIGLVLTMSQTFNQLTASLYQVSQSMPSPNASSQSNVLSQIYRSVKSLDWVDVTTTEYFRLLKSPYKISNFRLFNRIIDEEMNSQVLNQYTVRDSQWLIMLDNAKPSLKLDRRSRNSFIR